MNKKKQTDIIERYTAAAESFIGKVKDDPNVIAFIICGSLAYDVVWEKSDIDTTLVVRDQHLANTSYCIIEDGITINVDVITRSEFKRGMGKMIGGSFGQSYYSRGKMVYTSDDSLIEYFEELKKFGSDDIALYVFYTSCEIVGLYHKCQKWLNVRKDLLYTQYYLLKSVEAIARMEVSLNGEPPGREAILRALQLNPGIINPLYRDAMSHQLSEDEIKKDFELIENYLEQHLDIIKKPALEFLDDQELKTVTLIKKRFQADSHFIVGIFDYLAEKGIVEKVSQTIRITPKSRLAVEEIGYLYVP